MKWQLRLFSANKIKKKDLGGFAWKLPKKGEHGEPADLPEEVTAGPALLALENSKDQRESKRRGSVSKSRSKSTRRWLQGRSKSEDRRTSGHNRPSCLKPTPQREAGRHDKKEKRNNEGAGSPKRTAHGPSLLPGMSRSSSATAGLNL